MNHSKRSYVRVMEFSLTQARHIQECGACGRSKPPLSHFTYAMQRVATQLPKIHKKWQQEAQDIEHRLCETKEAEGKGAITYDERGNLMFSKENKGKVDKEKYAESEKDKFDIIPYYVNLKSIPDGLTEQELDNFEGFIIRHKDVLTIKANREAEFGSENSDVEDPEEVETLALPASEQALGLDETEENQTQ